MLIMNDLEQKLLDKIMDLQRIIIQKENDFKNLKALYEYNLKCGKIKSMLDVPLWN